MSIWKCEVCGEKAVDPAPLAIRLSQGANLVAVACGPCRDAVQAGKRVTVEHLTDVAFGVDITPDLIKKGFVDADGNWPVVGELA